MIFDFISGEASTQEGGEKFAKWLAEDTDLTKKEKKSVVEKIKDFFTKLLDAVRSVIEGQGTLNTTARAGQKAAQQVPVLDDFFNALDNAIDNRQRMLDGDTAQKNSTGEKTGADVRFSIDPNFEKVYDQWDKKTSGFSFRVGTTSKVLQQLGVDNRKIWWDASKIKKIKVDHPAMTDTVIKQVPNILENPILVMESKTKKGSLTLFGEVYDQKNNPVLAVLLLNPTDRGGNSLNILKVASAYGKDTNPQSLINSSKILYVEPNKKRTQNWLTVNRLQLPLPSSSYGFINTIVANKPSGVNTHSMQNGQKNAQNGENNTRHSLEVDSPDIRYSKRVGFDNALAPAEWKKYNRATQTGEDAGLRVSDNSILVECENDSKYQYKYVIYDDMEDGPVIRDVYAIGRLDPNVEDDVASQCHNIARYIRDVEELKYDNTKQHESVLGTCIQDTSYLLAEYNNRSKRFHVIGRGSVENGTNTFNKSVRERTAGQDTRVAGELTESRKSKSIDDTGRTSLLRDEYAQEVLDTLRGMAITLSDEQKAETAYHHDQYGNDLLFLYFASKSTAISTATPKVFCFLSFFTQAKIWLN